MFACGTHVVQVPAIPRVEELHEAASADRGREVEVDAALVAKRSGHLAALVEVARSASACVADDRQARAVVADVGVNFGATLVACVDRAEVDAAVDGVGRGAHCCLLTGTHDTTVCT